MTDSIPDEYVREAVDQVHGILTNLRTRLDRAANGAHAAPAGPAQARDAAWLLQKLRDIDAVEVIGGIAHTLAQRTIEMSLSMRAELALQADELWQNLQELVEALETTPTADPPAATVMVAMPRSYVEWAADRRDYTSIPDMKPVDAACRAALAGLEARE